MSLGSCPRCWESICECGEKYSHFPADRLREFIEVLLIRLYELDPGNYYDLICKYGTKEPQTPD